MRSSITALAAVLTLSCAGVLRNARPVAPEQAGVGAWAKLAQLRSFRFSLSFHTDAPLPIEVRFTGVREQADREVWSGYMRRRTELSKVELRAEGPYQFERERSGWRRTKRGTETRVLEQGEGTFRGRPLEFVGTERGRYRFVFRPDLPILDPTQSKKLVGVMEVDPNSGLPVRLYCSDSAGTAEWELRLGRFNRAGSVDVPYEPAMTLDATPTKRLNRSAFGLATAVVNQRLTRLGWDGRLRRTARGLTLLLGQTKSRRQVDLLFSRGRVEVWQGRWVSAGESTGAGVEVGGDASRRVLLELLLAENERIAAEVRAATPLSAALATSVEISADGGLAVLVVDGAAMSSASPGPGGELLFQDMGNEDDVRVIAALANGGVTPSEFRVTVRP
ncbi:hypothetical protein FJY68_05965 [candidate division WOR-3 bacterium]|uniref:Uncharacterized protein n=1 Tax=candidate division WOR-3 bacterium TaxID=2052148 RepID=A0A937XCX3_UNCW3|nr:hypothetical protein [candidate division WOR-3 bacterium]